MLSRRTRFAIFSFIMLVGGILLVALIRVWSYLPSPDRTFNFVANLQMACEAYKAEVGHYPRGTEDVLLDALTGIDRGSYLTLKEDNVEAESRRILDPWGHSIRYRFPGKHNKNGFDIWSAGEDGKDDTNDDISNFDD